MTETNPTPVAVLGLGSMGRALATTLLRADHPVTVWNRTPGRAGELVAQGASEAETVHGAVSAADLVVVCLYDEPSVRATLETAVASVRDRAVVNLTTMTPDAARDTGRWLESHGAHYLDGAIMATPGLIGTPHAAILYSGSRAVFDEHRALFDRWATSTYDGEDAGMAALFDLAMLSGMYSLFAGFLHGAAMVQSAGVPAAEFGRRAEPFLAAMTGALPESAKVVDGRDYRDPVQSLDWTSTVLDVIAAASREQGVEPVPVDMVRQIVRHQIDAGRGGEDFDRIIESLR